MPLSEFLRAQLGRHAPADATERRHLERMRVLLEAPGAFARQHFNPGHFTASAFVRSPDGRALLLVHHRKLDRWLQPGGHVDATDPDLSAAARREVSEEVGLDELEFEGPGIFDLDVHAIPALGAEPPHEHFDVRFLFRASTDQLRAGEEITAARWFPLAEVDERLSDVSVMRALRKLGAR